MGYADSNLGCYLGWIVELGRSDILSLTLIGTEVRSELLYWLFLKNNSAVFLKRAVFTISSFSPENACAGSGNIKRCVNDKTLGIGESLQPYFTHCLRCDW